jgi:hypothetical protein
VGISVFVMPLRTWLAGDFRTTWGPDGESAPPHRRDPELAAQLSQEFLARLEPLLGGRLEWDEEGPPMSATAYSVHAFSLPFLQARRWAYRLPLPHLGALETPQIWIPADAASAISVECPWSDDDLMIGSLPRLRTEFDRLLESLQAEDEEGDWAELREVAKVARSLRHVGSTAMDARMPVIVEG